MKTEKITNTILATALRRLPSVPGVYLFKDAHDQIVYIGKAKNLKKRGAQYVQQMGYDVKIDTIAEQSVTLEHIQTTTELEALMLEAKLIQSHQPPCNVLLKSGQPFVYIFVSSGSLPELKIVRNQKQKGSYFGPFLEKGAARKVYDFLIKTFRLKLCKKKIEKGCLFYHMGLCAGSCRPDFDKEGYLDRIELAKNSLKYGHKKFLDQLKEKMNVHNQQREFERSRELYGYYQAFERVFSALESKPTDIEERARKDVWILTEDTRQLYVFGERDSVLKKKHIFYFPFVEEMIDPETINEHFESYYRTFMPPATILVNFDLEEDKNLYEEFFKQWYNKDHDIDIIQPAQGHYAGLVRLATIHAEQERLKQSTLARALRTLLRLDKEPRTIDCFDISHKQGMFMVGSCVRFTDGKPDKPFFRHFHIKTLTQIDDYAALREIVSRRYTKHLDEIPDLIVIDGGKGQLNAVADLFPQAEFISLAKREETVYSKRLPDGKILDQKQYAAQVIIALRDYAHHFAISFHRSIEEIKQ